MLENWAPIIIFAYRRPEHLRRTILSLMRCDGFANSPVYIYLDGAKTDADITLVNQTRMVARTLLPQRTIFVESPQNLGLANSILSGVTEVCRKHERVIVMEDDIEVAPQFLNFMNQGLLHYADTNHVMQVSGYVQPLYGNVQGDAVFLPYISSWAWGTWWRSWKQFAESSIEERLKNGRILLANRQVCKMFDLQGTMPFSRTLFDRVHGKADVWAVLWYLHVFLNKGLVLYPTKTLARNIGFDGSGTNIRKKSVIEASYDNVFLNTQKTWAFPKSTLNDAALKAAQNYFKTRYSIRGRLKSKVVHYLKMFSAKVLFAK